MKRHQIALALSALTIPLLCLGNAAAQPTATVNLLGLTSGNEIVSFPASNPSRVRMLKVTGVEGKLIGIDQRPANGLLYGLSNQGKIYTINLETGGASLVSTLAKPLGKDAKISIDFNPVPDRLRLVDDKGNNFRVNVDTGEMTTDKPLGYIADDPNAGKVPQIRAIAYTNAFSGPPSPAGVSPPTRTAQMFDLDPNLNILAQQNPPNDGRLKTIGSLGVDLATSVGFDIFSQKMGENMAFVVSGSSLYSINLATGATTAMGKVGNGKISSLIDLAATPMP
jgi:hypothetical protein